MAGILLRSWALVLSVLSACLLLPSASGQPGTYGVRFLTALAGILELTVYNGTVVFTGCASSDIGCELFLYDLYNAPYNVVDLLPGPQSSAPSSLTGFGSSRLLFFAAFSPATGVELYSFDMSSANTTDKVSLVSDIYPGPQSSYPSQLVALGASLYFRCTISTIVGAELCTYNTQTGNFGYHDIYAQSSSSFPQGLTAFNGVLLFSASTAAYGTELWQYDPSNVNNVPTLVADINPGPASSNPCFFALFNGIVYFQGIMPAVGGELLSYAPARSPLVRLVADLEPGNTTADAIAYAELVAAGNASGVAPQPTGSYPNSLTAVGNRLFFTATTSLNGSEVWWMNGATEATMMVEDLNPGPGNSNPASFTAFNGRLFLSEIDPVYGQELRTINAFANGSELVYDLVPGPYGSNPSFLYVLNGLLLFSAYNGTTGQGLWMYADPRGLALPQPSPTMTPTYSSTASGSVTTSLLPSTSASITLSPTESTTGSLTGSPSATWSGSQSGSWTLSPSASDMLTGSVTASESGALTVSLTPSATMTSSLTATASGTASISTSIAMTPLVPATPSVTRSAGATPSNTLSPSSTLTASPTPLSPSLSSSASPTRIALAAAAANSIGGAGFTEVPVIIGVSVGAVVLALCICVNIFYFCYWRPNHGEEAMEQKQLDFEAAQLQQQAQLDALQFSKAGGGASQRWRGRTPASRAAAERAAIAASSEHYDGGELGAAHLAALDSGAPAMGVARARAPQQRQQQRQQQQRNSPRREVRGPTPVPRTEALRSYASLLTRALLTRGGGGAAASSGGGAAASSGGGAAASSGSGAAAAMERSASPRGAIGVVNPVGAGQACGARAGGGGQQRSQGADSYY